MDIQITYKNRLGQKVAGGGNFKASGSDVSDCLKQAAGAVNEPEKVLPSEVTQIELTALVP